MSKESTYKPNFILNAEDGVTPEKAKFVEVDIDESAITSPRDTIKNGATLIHREVEFIEKQRTKLRLADPKGLYFYRHVSISYFQSALHLLSLLASCYLIYFMISLSMEETKAFVTGIGWVSNTTFIDTIADITLLIILFVQLRGLFKSNGLVEPKRYRLAMMANAINSVVINYLKLSLLFFSLLMLFILVEGVNQVDTVMVPIENGVVSDVIDAIFSFYIIFIVLRAFRFCRKELAE